MLRTATIFTNFLALAAAVWLGIYIVTRSPRRLISWLTGLSLWTLAGLFINVLLALDPPPAAALPDWSRLFLPFWPLERIAEPSGWLQGWSVTPAIAFWHHVTTLMRPGPMTLWRRARVTAAYLVAGAAVVIQAFTPFMFSVEGGDPLYISTLHAGPYYPFFAVCLLIFSWWSLINLLRSAREVPFYLPRRQFQVLAGATLLSGLVGVFSILGSSTQLPIPLVLLAAPLGIAVGLIGAGVARYSALVEGRTMQRDFNYQAVASGLVILLYLGATSILTLTYKIPSVISILIIVLAITTHSLVSVGRRALDSIFYRERTRELRASLQTLARQAGEREDLAHALTHALETICQSVRATFGVILSFEAGSLVLLGAYRWSDSVPSLPSASFKADDFRHLEPGGLPPPLAEAALLIPLFADTEQIGVLVLGRPVNGLRYSAGDLERLLDPSDRIAYAMADNRRSEEYLAKIAQLTRNGHSALRPVSGDEIRNLEDALRNLADFSYLGDSPLTGFKHVQAHYPQRAVTHVDRGKAVYTAITAALEKLRPEGECEQSPPAREWYPYLILKQAYLEDIPNREIMARLYISEGTFNRTRRGAIRALARVLSEMETARS
jgi:hypothetical protein